MSNIMRNHAASEVLPGLYLKNERADVHFVFKIDDKIEKVPANKVILASISPVFDAMFFGALKEGDEVEIVDADVESFKEFLQFFYLSHVTLTMENMKTVVRLADKYDILPYVDFSAIFYTFEEIVNDLCWSYQLAASLKSDILITFCEELMGKKIIGLINRVFKSESFLRLNKELLKNILKIMSENYKDNGDDAIHTDAIPACMEWAKHSCKLNGLDENRAQNLRIELGDCLHLINFSRMKIEEFTTFAAAYKGLFNSEEFEDIVYTISVEGYESKIFNQFESASSDLSKQSYHGPFLYVQQLEVLTFKSKPNRSLKLIKIRTTTTFGEMYIPNSAASKVKVMIIEREDRISSLDYQKIIYDDWCETWSEHKLEIILPRSISIDVEKIYEIRIYIPLLYGYYYLPNYTMWGQTNVRAYPNQGGERISEWISDLIFE